MGTRDDPSKPSLIGRACRAVWRMLRWLTGFDGLPYLARPTFRHEQAGIIAISIALSVTMGGFCIFFAEKGFEVSGWMLAALAASPAAGSFAGAMLTGTLRRWRQPTVIAGCMVLAAIMSAAVVFLPVNKAAAPVFTALMVATAAVIMVSFQARVAIWQANYPPGKRGGIVSRNLIVQTILMAALSQIASGLLDWHRPLYRLLYLIAALAFLASGLLFARIRVRGEALRLKQDARARPSLDPLAIIRIFRRDHAFAKYEGYQMILGAATLATVPIVPRILREVFDASYSEGNLALMTFPLMTQILLLPVLGRMFDRISIFRFRTFGATMWGISRLILTAGVATVMMPLVILSSVFVGAGQTFGRLAWSAGHMEFAKPEETHLYMGAHMMLTGIRGLTMPFLGIWLYTNVLGLHVLWINAIIQLAVAIAYWVTDPHRPAPTTAPTPSNTYVP